MSEGMFQVWRARWGNIDGPIDCIKETDKCFILKDGRRRTKESSWETYRRDKSECEAIAKAYNDNEAAKKVLMLKQKAAPELYKALDNANVCLVLLMNPHFGLSVEDKKIIMDQCELNSIALAKARGES